MEMLIRTFTVKIIGGGGWVMLLVVLGGWGSQRIN